MHFTSTEQVDLHKADPIRLAPKTNGRQEIATVIDFATSSVLVPPILHPPSSILHPPPSILIFSSGTLPICKPAI
jgi:hypothetical protein